jgi:alpha-amylase/alpha-mannosidase (GH57 family)
MTALIIHGHFYQPPRENPWTGRIEREAGAAPFHDWNERIHAECYAPNAVAKIVAEDGRITGVTNNYEHISFNFGPTLLSWLETHHPDTYRRVLTADATSIPKRSGHGNAIAQAYGHAILPLCNDHDLLTQVAWGLADFRHRFKRDPESLWLPETACNDRTLSVLIEQGLRYVILAPNQALVVRQIGTDQWTEVNEETLDTSQPYLYEHMDGSGRGIVIFFYNASASKAVAFEKALTSSQGLAEHFKRSAGDHEMLSIATDGETYGHHFKFGELCLAHLLTTEAASFGFELTNYGEYLDNHPPRLSVKIQHGISGEGSSWSCVHGLGRWSRDCGCHTGGDEGWNQQWREPLRLALEFLRDAAAEEFSAAGSEVFRNPWEARNAYIQVVLDEDSRFEFLRIQARPNLSPAEERRALRLMEMQRYSLLMFTSCGWFFSELSGIETLQVLKYAGRVLELLTELGLRSPRDEFLSLLSRAKSNIEENGTGADIFRKLIESAPRVLA